MRWAALFAAALCGSAQALPGAAGVYIPILKSEIAAYWPGQSPRAFIPALIEQESNWKLSARLKTDREFGCGLGQFTVAYRADGSVRFDALEEMKQKESSLSGWTWRNCYEAQYQLRAVVLKLHSESRACEPHMNGVANVAACAAAKYNGGSGSVAKRIRSCRITPGCIPEFWYGHLDRHCPQSAKRVAGYGESFCEINSKYPGRIRDRMPKYTDVMGSP